MKLDYFVFFNFWARVARSFYFMKQDRQWKMSTINYTESQSCAPFVFSLSWYHWYVIIKVIKNEQNLHEQIMCNFIGVRSFIGKCNKKLITMFDNFISHVHQIFADWIFDLFFFFFFLLDFIHRGLFFKRLIY